MVYPFIYNRLGKMVGYQLTKGNSEIQQISIDRPTELAEKWSSLFTDEWSDVYYEITMNRTIKNENFRVEKQIFEIVKVNMFNIFVQNTTI